MSKQNNYKTVYDFYTYEENNKKIKNRNTSFMQEPPLHKEENYKNYFDIITKRDHNYSKEEERKKHMDIKPEKDLEMRWETFNGTLSTPEVWGPSRWFTFHTSAIKYPENPAPLVRERMKNIILGIPVLLPCENCKEHSTAYIESRLNELDDIVSTRDKLFNFFVDFHNYVNKRYGKKIFTYEEARKLYTSDVKLTKLSYR